MVLAGKLIAASVVMLLGPSLLAAEEFTVPNLVLQGVAGANLVTNGGFETGTFSGWTQAGNTSFTSVQGFGEYAGNYTAYMGPVTSSGSLTQTLTTVAGTRYDLSYQLRSIGSTPNRFDVYWNGGAIASLSLSNAGTFGWTSFSALNLVATGPTTSLSFVFRHDPGYFFLDEVAVTTATPEPSTIALVGATLLIIGTYRRRKSSSQRPSPSDLRT